jgi:hypothetical protein
MKSLLMRSNLVIYAARRLIAIGMAWAAAFGAASGQELPSLSSAISPDAAEVWSADQSELPYDAGDGFQPIPMDPDDAAPYVPGSACSSCQGGGAGGYFHNRCGCNTQLFPWFTGPGNCDNWCVGPHWNVEVDALMLTRDDINWDPVIADVGLAPDLASQLDYSPGARIFAMAYNDSSFGMQIGYEGVNEFNATALFPVVGATRSFDFQSTMNSLEFNVFRKTDIPTKFFAGFRYIEVDEDLIDLNIVDKSVPAPSTPPTVVSFADDALGVQLENRLMGVQAGAFRDAWKLNRWITIEPFGNAGVYVNSFKRVNVNSTTTTTLVSDDPATPADDETLQTVTTTNLGTKQEFSELAFVGEAGVTGVLRLNRCVALRGGYQFLAVNGVTQAIDAYFIPGMDSSTLVYHGLRFGVEYQR